MIVVFETDTGLHDGWMLQGFKCFKTVWAFRFGLWRIIVLNEGRMP